MKRNILSVFLFFATVGVYADAEQSHDLLKNKIETHVLNELASYAEGKVQVVADKIDPRMNLNACAEDQLKVFNPYQTAALNTTTMAIKCLETNNPWTLYVPIKVSVLKTVLVARKALIRGKKIGEDDIYQAEMDTQKLKQGYFTNKKELIGLISKQDIYPDTPLTPLNIELAKLIHKGEQVTIGVNNDNLNVSMPGIALNDGVLGDTVRVQNLTSKRIIEAQVAGKKNVKIIL